MPSGSANGFVRLGDDRTEEAAIKAGAAATSIVVHDPYVLSSELHRLRIEDLASATRIEQLDLTASECDILSLSVRKMNDLGAWAETYSSRTAWLFATQVVCAAAVPVLIGLLGSFKAYYVDLVMRLVAITLSVLGTLCRVVEDAYDWRSQALIRRRYLTRMRVLFDNFCVLSGEHFDPDQPGAHAKGYASRRGRATPGVSGCFAASPYGANSESKSPSPSPSHAPLATSFDEFRGQHSGANFRRYVVAFSTLEDQCSVSLTAIHERHRATS